MDISEVHSFTLVQNGVTIFAAISPCSWMYDDYGMQVKLTAGEQEGVNAESEFVRWPTPFAKCTHTELHQKVREFVSVQGFVQKLLDAKASWAKAEAEFRAADAVRAEQAAKKLKADDAKQKATGMTHRVDGWIHPKRGGDDRCFRLYGQNLTDAIVINWLKKRSCITTDYVITKL